MMDPNLEKMIKQTFEISKANHQMLKKVRSHQRWQSMTKIIYWLLIFGVMSAVYIYALKPLLSQVTETYSSITEGIDGIQNTTESISGIGTDVSSIFNEIIGTGSNN